MSLRIELFKTEEAGYTVIVNGRFADRLCPDEALGVVAAALYAGAQRIPYITSYEEWLARERRYRVNDIEPVAGLLTTRTASRDFD